MSKNSAAWSRWSPLRRRKPCTSLRAEDRRGWRSLRFRKRRQRHFPCRCRSLRNRRTAPRLRKRRRSDYWKPSLYSKLCRLRSVWQFQGRVWGRIPAPISLFLEKPEHTVLIGRFTLISTPTGCRVNGQESVGCCVLYRPMVFCRCLISECPDVGCITRVNTQTVVIRNRTQRLRRVGCRGDREA